MRLAALSIDLDALRYYYRIHGLAEPPASSGDVRPDPVYSLAVERFGELCRRLRLRATVFCVGAEMGHPDAARMIRTLAAEGHEIANHTQSHDYSLTRCAPERIAAEIRAGGEAVTRVVGRPPVGFRAPGYTLCGSLIAALIEQGYQYDSSAFPAAPYYLAKAAALSAMALLGRSSQALLDRPRVLLAPKVPYRPRLGEPYARGAMPLIELPVTTGLFAFPLIGTFVGTLPHWMLRLLRLGTDRRPFFNLELHGIDLLDASDATAALASRQRDLWVPAALKIVRIERFIRELDRDWMTLEEVAERLAAGPEPL